MTWQIAVSPGGKPGKAGVVSPHRLHRRGLGDVRPESLLCSGSPGGNLGIIRSIVTAATR
ncbi:hypothetical protein [Thermobispora bispora]|uniref:hypothetical protein n=1 Tax=Thermobispora bispora TaxID=2006 RepID=UPI003341C6B7